METYKGIVIYKNKDKLKYGTNKGIGLTKQTKFKKRGWPKHKPLRTPKSTTHLSKFEIKGNVSHSINRL